MILLLEYDIIDTFSKISQLTNLEKSRMNDIKLELDSILKQEEIKAWNSLGIYILNKGKQALPTSMLLLANEEGRRKLQS
jgi:hypothetical protein